MKTKFWTVVLVCAAAGTCLAQNSGPEPHRSNTQIIDFILNLQEKSVLDVAEVMPAEKYNFAPTGGEFKGVRTFGEQLKHIAADNYLLGAGILGEKPPVDVGTKESGATSLHAKAEIMAYLKDSFAYMHRAAAAIDEAKIAIPTPEISPWPAGTATRLGLAIEDCVHTWDHYGQMVEYLRMNGIIPPDSRPAASQQGPAQTGLTVSQALDFWITRTEEKVVPAAQAMPEEKYYFAPTAGEFAGVRTFAQQVKHLAACNYRMAAYMLGATPTPDQEAEIGPETVRSKAEIVEYLKGSFAATHRAVATLNEGNLVTALAAGPSPTVRTRLQLAVLVVGHPNDHYGQMVEYLRMSGIVPPASRSMGSHTTEAQGGPTVGEALDYWITNTEKEVVPAAEAMPERKYSFAPRGRGFGGVRTFGEQLKHLAANNYRMAAYISGRKPRQEEESESGPTGVRSKAQIVDYLKGSFTALHRAAAAINSENMLQPLGLPFKQNTRLQLAVDAVAHSYDHYGQVVEYLRMNEVVPPASRK